MTSSTGDRLAAVVVSSEHADRTSVCGLTLTERARRVARAAGAEHVAIIRHGNDAAAAREALTHRDLLVIRAADQMVHTPLAAAAMSSTRADVPTVAVDPNTGAPAGAMFVPAAYADEFFAAPERDVDLARRWLAAGAIAAPHGDIARHPATTRAECRDATRMLFRLVRKPQDSALIRHVNRRVSYPFTRLLLPTPVTPNAISLMVFAVGALGCWFVSQPGYWNPVVGTLLVLFAGYLDGCDGEVARLRLESSRLGAWLDTIVDETTTILFLVAVGLHVHATHALDWLPWTIAVGAAAAVASVYVIYYYLIVVAHSCNSQDYPTESGGPLEPLRRVIKRDFINLAAVGFAAANLVEIMYALLLAGAVGSAIVLLRQHVALRTSGRGQAIVGPQ